MTNRERLTALVRDSKDAYPELHEVLLELCPGGWCKCGGTGYVPRDLSWLPEAYRGGALKGMLMEALIAMSEGESQPGNDVWTGLYDALRYADVEGMCEAILAAIEARKVTP